MDQTPREIRGHMERELARRRLCDLAAWMTGRYVASALLNPGGYPSEPCFFPAPQREMTDEEMLLRVQAMARKGEEQ